MIHTYDAADETLIRAKPLHTRSDIDLSVGFDAGADVAAFTAEMHRLDTFADVPVDTATLDGSVGTATVSELDNGVRYRLTGIFTRADGSQWFRSVIIDCND